MKTIDPDRLTDAYFRSLGWENDSTRRERVWTRIDFAFQARRSFGRPWRWTAKGKEVPEGSCPQTITSAVEQWPDHSGPPGEVDYATNIDTALNDMADRVLERITSSSES